MRRRKNALVELLEYAAYRVVAVGLRFTSDEAVHRWGGRLGTLGSKVLRSRHRLALRNLREIFPEKPEWERRSILAESWRHFGREMLRFVRIQSMPLEAIVARCQFFDVSNFEAAMARGKGVLIISAHYGSWEVGGLAVMALVNKVTTVARPLDNRYLQRDLARLRARTGAEVVDRRGAARPLMKALMDNGVVILLPDQAVQPREGVRVPFMGRNAWTTPAPAKIAVRVASTIVFAFCIPDERGYRLEFEEPIVVDQLSEAERDPVALTARINDGISRRIAQRPELWLWMHDRWKGSGNG
ncbi:MAG TPA: lysophospholipid acyltransferase family protein [Thermoanaerobaculia bacterium]|nr:lysophospholipid acyltransferase family protein [Thermoanaerobaculia bacterium]